MTKIFGREPALIVGVVGSLITLLVALKLPFLSAGQGAAIVTFLSALLIAAATRPIAPALFAAVIAPTASLFAQYGLHWSDAVVAALGGAILAVFSFFGIRPQVTPSADPAPQEVTYRP